MRVSWLTPWSRPPTGAHATDSWRLSPAALDAACADDATKPRILLLNSPSNPTGAAYSDSELRALADVCRKYRILVISDEIYGCLAFDGGYNSIARHYPEVRGGGGVTAITHPCITRPVSARGACTEQLLLVHTPQGTVVMSGASKWLGSGGWRVGFASLPPELAQVRAGILTAASETFTSVSAPLQHGVIPGFLPR